MSSLATIQFSRPIPRRRYFQQKVPLNTQRSPARMLHRSPRSTSLQFGESRVRQRSSERDRELSAERKRFREELDRLNQENDRLNRQLYHLQNYNDSLNIRNILELQRIVYLQDRITQEEDWYKLRSDLQRQQQRI